ncbi:nickel pincer cofactor biosynthesis protein LarC [bacterium]|nr:nickel pincer cofactor biosynthesis protein LarC [bacterium]MBP9809854.1 nickel pincer cofactor biosynthesis protein LarC [bacterium]
MKIAYFDCSFGAAGDMLVAACLDAGASLPVLEEQLAGLNLPEGSYKLVKSAVNRCSIRATKFDVQLLEHIHSNDDVSHEHTDSDEHGHSHSHDHSHENSHDHEHSSDHSYQRSLSEILGLIENSSLDSAVKELASKIFNRLGLAESQVHGVAVDKIHFHEVGAIDAIVDIVGFAIAYNQLAIEAAYVSALPLGGGTVQTMHGLFPMPGPAVLNLLKEVGAPTRAFDVRYECLTPTGAAILTTISQGWGQHPAFLRIDSVGYGAGTINPDKHPNVVRLIVGQSVDLADSSGSSGFKGSSSIASNTSTGAVYRSEVIAVLETNLDDCSPQVLAHAMERLIEEGALDVAIVPQTMKKGRPGHKLSVVAKSEDSLPLQELILRETTSLGVRSYFCERIVLERNFQEISLGEGPPVRIKVGRDLNGKIVNFHPEYDDVVENARSTQRSLKEVLLQSLTLAANQVGGSVEND